jgi:Gpi18-like mannosyltransferase
MVVYMIKSSLSLVAQLFVRPVASRPVKMIFFSILALWYFIDQEFKAEDENTKKSHF